jgi:hypothetical protein
MSVHADTLVTVTTEYTTPYSAVVRDEIVMGVSRYFLERWVPILGPGPAAVVTALRQLDYRCHGEAITISGEALAREAAMSRRYLYTCLETPWMGAFVRMESGQRTRSDSGKITQETNRYTVRLDDPLTPADADHLITVLTRLGDTPLDAAQRALELDARALWSPDPARQAERFTDVRPINARDVLLRAFPTWQALNNEQKLSFSQAAENLHRHLTLVRDDGKTSKIIVPQYFRKFWWKRLGHELAWSYLWLRGCVYENAEEGVRRETCWIASLDNLLTLIGRPREWWRRNVENAPVQAEGWAITDFFKQIEAQKGRDPDHPQWVARQFFVSLDLPIAPEDRARYHDLLQQWRGESLPPAGSATAVHTGEDEVCHDCAHRSDDGLPHSDTPDQPGSATAIHTGNGGVRHIQTQGSATTAHRESESQNQASLVQVELSNNSSKQQADTVTDKTAAGAESDKIVKFKATPGEKNQPLFERLEEISSRAPETPLFRAAGVAIWLRDVWPEPIRPHTPVWTAAVSGQVAPQDLVALILAIWADTSIKHPPRYLSWLIQRWQTLPDAPPVDHWEQWKALAGMTLKDWMQRGRMEWIELAPQNNRALPFGLELLVDDDADEGAVPEVIPDPLPIPAADQAPDGLDETPGGGSLTVRDLWRATLGQLSVQLNPSTYTNWVEGTKAVSYADGVLTVCARHGVARDLLAQRLNQSIELSISRLARTPITVRYTTGE